MSGLGEAAHPPVADALQLRVLRPRRRSRSAPRPSIVQSVVDQRLIPPRPDTPAPDEVVLSSSDGEEDALNSTIVAVAEESAVQPTSLVEETAEPMQAALEGALKKLVELEDTLRITRDELRIANEERAVLRREVELLRVGTQTQQRPQQQQHVKRQQQPMALGHVPSSATSQQSWVTVVKGRPSRQPQQQLPQQEELIYRPPQMRQQEQQQQQQFQSRQQHQKRKRPKPEQIEVSPTGDETWEMIYRKVRQAVNGNVLYKDLKDHIVSCKRTDKNLLRLTLSKTADAQLMLQHIRAITRRN
ncbi:protein lag-3-like [Anopheles funestus]|uniref:protein lag-3-like n=1 Tax=Anopheles funestus TaxID=62324 RepID=UPI0020C71787|nr:protein lag-3-like [Anopheles funestus]